MKAKLLNLMIFNNTLINGFSWGPINKMKEIFNYLKEVIILDIVKKKLDNKPLKYNIWQI